MWLIKSSLVAKKNNKINQVLINTNSIIINILKRESIISSMKRLWFHNNNNNKYSETRKNNLKLLVTEVKFLKISFNFNNNCNINEMQECTKFYTFIP